MKLRILPPAEQGSGEFDGGAITEQKPIGFSGEGSAIHRLGPLFYWAWAHAEAEGFIGSHPHQAFEILTYVIHGQAYHGDSLGTESIVGPGGAQLIQAGSGVYHQERLVGPDAELFQIWFEPNIRDALRRDPQYAAYEAHEFPEREQEGVTVKTVIGGPSPIHIVADAGMWDVSVSPGASYVHALHPNRTLAVLAVRGGGECSADDAEAQSFAEKDFLVLRSEEDGQARFAARGTNGLRFVLIEVPTEVDYPLYPKKP
ncbi:pirin family protein [Paenibacillus apiarius]|uniref:Pirin family protein n=1 Tax=Paenibacillus apiarius TaxID=46240 RepID=A0ABT4DPZ6_9BACL|nr:pirin family protein [Paenibacillus apiarius]MCY9513915.1 pirin family protein [Paenibacillus apiarius]MCY9519432.1 pirin family protein [Paenibacillus apiarius]MCY9552341.1 pirin family protein [Paenibacillus apiarius]MCY9556187.1 pirin family protein [Paenibacillus apiarius]MCY9681722.1 pirin family protein [Paenibacillus apiarius]